MYYDENITFHAHNIKLLTACDNVRAILSIESIPVST